MRTSEEVDAGKDVAAEAPIRVAVVEDDEQLRQTLGAFLNRSSGLRFVAGYGSGEAALKGVIAR
jgi:DNA-binding NarL/FixJ family response regulator